MVLIILGIVLLVISYQLRKQNSPTVKYAGTAFGAGLFLMVAGALATTVIQIDAGKVGVQVLFGEVQKSNYLNSGLHLVNPFVQIVEFDTRTKNYTMSAVHDEGAKQGDDAIKVLSADGLEVVIDLTVLYRAIPAQTPNILEKIGADYEEVIVRPITRTKTRDIAVYYDAVSLFSTRRDEFQERITKGIEADFNKRGLVLEQLLVRNINLPTSVKASIESKINAEQEAQKMQFVLQKEKQEAERKRVEAQGIADYQKIIGTGLSEKQLQYEMIKAQKELSLSPNTKVIVLGGKGNTPLLINGN
jgi:regulator of protease activity HflC (stomatin/prohibitin superfamily)